MSLDNHSAIFLDRDGIINVDHGYVYKINEFEFNDGIFDLLRNIQKKGYLLIIVTNQSGIGRGYYSEEAYQELTQFIIETCLKRDIVIHAVYHCPHTPENGCHCRKPKPGMFKEAQKEFHIDMHRSWMIGDKDSDMLAAKNAGIHKRILVSAQKSPHANFCVSDIKDIEEIIK